MTKKNPSNSSTSSSVTKTLQTNSLDTLKGLSKEQVTRLLGKISPEQKKELIMNLAVAGVERAGTDLFYFLDTMVYTQDEHDLHQPIKKMPMHKEYMRELAGHFLNEQLLLVEKSRQMMVTWIMVACHLWDVMFHEGRRVFFQSKKEADANHLVDRAKVIYRNIPEPFKSVIYEKYPARMPMAYLKLEFPRNQSIIQGTAQGADVIRQYTASRIFSDELAFQEKAEEAFIAAKPTLVGGGSFVGVSTPNFKNFFYLLAKDLIE